MLWKKESNSPNALYVNIFAVDPIQSDWLATHESRRSDIHFYKLKKIDSIAVQKRNKGNAHFKKNEWTKAMNEYGESLCYAKDSTNLSLAYANRSTCFLKLKMYKEALKDIELAKEAGYPANLMPKLNQRKVECLKGIKGGTRLVESDFKLSFDSDEYFPCMANVLKIERDVHGNYSVVAKEDIDVGKTVIFEDTIKNLHQEFGSKCIHCFKSYTNLVPCKKCCVAMFCSTECHTNSLHDDECGMKFNDDTHQNGESMQTVRSIFKTMKLFSANAGELMSFVEETIASDKLPTTLQDERSKYRAFLKQRIGRKFLDVVFLGTHSFPVYTELLKLPAVKRVFNTEKYKRFLMHLIGHHVQIFHHNSCVVPSSKSPRSTEFYSYFGLMSRYFNHSCYPHTLMFGDHMGHCHNVYVTVRPIKKGEEVTTLWLPFLLELPRNKRQCKLWEYRQIRCKCSRCQSAIATRRERQQMTKDYDKICSMTDQMERRNVDIFEITSDLKDQLVSFLGKFGHLNWCEEIEDALMMYSTLCRVVRELE